MACGCAQSDSASALTGSQLRAMSGAELARLGEESLRSHLVDTAIIAHQRYAPFDHDCMASFLDDRSLVRHPVRLSFELGNMAPHQFANAQRERDGFVLYVHPALQGRAGDLALAAAYFIPLVNYGDPINDDHCLIYGATLNGLTLHAYYQQLCRIAALCGASPRDRDEAGGRF